MDWIHSQIIGPESNSTPVFKGISGERPDAHLLAAEDWMVAMRIRHGDLLKF